MADYIYLLETRLSKQQRSALDLVREVARARATMLFLVGGAVRDLTSGSPVRDLDVVVQGNALKMKKDFERAGAVIEGENDPGQALYLSFPGSVRMEVGSTLAATYPKPGKPVLKAASLLDDLRRRDFTANAMALSLNEGSYGLLMDPLNGVADIENRELRLASNYGFIEEPARMIRAARLMARLGWTMEEKTQARYETGKQEGYISALSSFHRGYETEEIFHEEDPLRVLRRLEEEGWMQSLNPALTVAKANVPEMERLRETQTQLQVQGIVTDASAANFPLLTGKLSPTEVAELKAMFPRQGFVAQIEGLEGEAKEFAAQMVAKTASLPSQAFQLIHRARPEAVLWAAHTSKSAALQNKLKSFYGEWPQARQKVPYVLMQEMRIVPELPVYEEVVEALFYALMDGRLGTTEELRAFLEPYSPPAPPPPVHLRRQRAAKKDVKAGKGRKKAVASVDPEEDEDLDSDSDSDSDSDTEDRPSGDDADEVDAAPGTEDVAADVIEVETEELDEIEPVFEIPAVKPVAIAEPDQTASPVEKVIPSPAVRAETPMAPESKAPVSKSAPVRVQKTKAEEASKAAEASKATDPSKAEEPLKDDVSQDRPAPVRSASAASVRPSPAQAAPAPSRAVTHPAKAVRQAAAPPSKKSAATAPDKRPEAKTAKSSAATSAPGKKTVAKVVKEVSPAPKKAVAPLKLPAKKSAPVKAAAAKKAVAAKAAPPSKKAGSKALPVPAKKAAKKGR